MAFKSDKVWYRLLMVGPFLVIVAGVITVWLAVRSNDGLVTDDYYKQGLAVNQTMQRDQQAASMALRGELMRAGDKLRLILSGKEGIAFPGELSLKLAHPTRAGHDQIITLKSEGGGLYSGKLTADVSGRWHVTIEDVAVQWRLVGDWQADAMEPLRLLASAEK